jgi:hypothetical protein
VATTTRNIENVGKTVETMTRTAQESAQIVTDYVAQAQELNARFAQLAFEAWIDTTRRQAELSQTVAGQLFGKTEEQTDSVQALFARMPTATTKNGRLPIVGYDEMNVEEISDSLDSLSDEELKRVRDYERRHKNRDTLIEQLDRKIRTSS